MRRRISRYLLPLYSLFVSLISGHPPALTVNYFAMFCSFVCLNVLFVCFIVALAKPFDLHTPDPSSLSNKAELADRAADPQT